MFKITAQVFILSSALFAQSVAAEITSPDELVDCMTNYVQEQILAPDTVGSWEIWPKFGFDGNYISTAWFSKNSVSPGSVFAWVNEESAIHCSYESTKFGAPIRDSAKCAATIADGEFAVTYRYFDGPDHVGRSRVIAEIIDSKIYCAYSNY